MNLYQTLLRPLLFASPADPEWLTRQTLNSLHWLAETQDHWLGSRIQSQLHQTCCISDPRLEQTLWGIRFPNPIGLAAGLDKDGIAAGIWPDFGFGFAEMGTVTPLAQPGNPRPRLFRLAQDQAALNRMGFNNRGAAAMADQLQRIPSHRIPLGINLGKGKQTPLEEAGSDYVASFQALEPYGDYFVVNVSSPNTPGLRDLQAVESLQPILQALQAVNSNQKPILVKISPDLAWADLETILTLIADLNLAGIIATNTTIDKQHLRTRILQGQPIGQQAGGISGAPLRSRATEVIRFIYQHTQGRIPIIGVGGIFTAEDAWDKITAGASLIQVYTGWIYEGPQMVRRILEGLRIRVDQHQLTNLSSAVGLQHFGKL